MAASDHRELRLGPVHCVVSASSGVLLVVGLACLLSGCCGGSANVGVDFAASVTSGPAPLTVSFTASSPYAATSWAWAFGDGGTSNEENPTHTYVAAGTYTVSLTVTPTYSVGHPSVATKTKEGYILVQSPSTSTHILTYTAGANGTITGSTPQMVTHGASGSPVTAVPNAGYHFAKWSDDVMTAARTDTNVTADITVTALFVINSYTLTYVAGANGTITGSTPQTVTHGASGSPVTAVPDTGYQFVKWSDDVVTAARTDANVTADITATATFAMAHKAYVANSHGDSVSVIDTTSNKVIDIITVGTNPMGIAISGEKAYVANYGSASVSVIDTVTNTVSATIPVGNYPVSIAISGKKAYVTNNGLGPTSDCTVSVINTETQTVSATILVGDHPWGVACTESGAYVTNNYDDTVSVISSATDTVIGAPIPVGDYPLGVAISGTDVYVANYNSSSLSVISTLTDTVIATIILEATPYCIAVRGSNAYVTTGTNSVLVVDTWTNKVSATIMLGAEAAFIAISGDKAYVSHPLHNSVSVIDLTTNTVAGTIAVGAYPCGIAITP